MNMNDDESKHDHRRLLVVGVGSGCNGIGHVRKLEDIT